MRHSYPNVGLGVDAGRDGAFSIAAMRTASRAVPFERLFQTSR
jgi:hypothetical protein